MDLEDVRVCRMLSMRREYLSKNVGVAEVAAVLSQFGEVKLEVLLLALYVM